MTESKKIFEALFSKDRESLETLLLQGTELQIICEKGEELRYDMPGKSPLACAFLLERWDEAEMLLDAGADPNYRMPDEQTAFSIWVDQEHGAHYIPPEQCRHLLDRLIGCGWDPELSADKEGNTALAVTCRHLREMGMVIVRYLLEHGADLNATNRCGQTPLMVLYGGGYWDGKIPPFPQIPRSDPYRNKFCGDEEAEVMGWLLSAGADTCRKDKWGNTLLHYIAAGCNKKGSAMAIEALADYPLPDVLAENNEGLNAIDIAVDKGNEVLTEFLLNQMK